MIASISAFPGCNILSQKFASCVMHSDFQIANSPAEHARRNWCFKARSIEITKEPSHHDEDTDNETIYFNDAYYKLPRSLSWLLESGEESKKLSLPIKPLPRKREYHKNSFGVILEWKGVIVEEDDPEIEPCSWHALSLLEKKTFPSAHILREIEGIKTEQALSEILKWSDNPNEVQRIASQKEHIYNMLRGKHYWIRPGTLEFISTLINYDVPVALVSDLSERSLKEAVDSIGLKYYFDAIVSVQDVEMGKPEPDLYELAAQKIAICPERCVVFGNTDLMTEAARSAGMRCVAVASRYPVYELGAADHVVRWLDQVSFRDLLALADGDPIGARARAWASSMEIVIEE
jgi:5-amino-6-(5-phospho-D-ribitylamino)uracil phosphatase